MLNKNKKKANKKRYHNKNQNNKNKNDYFNYLKYFFTFLF